MDEGLEAVSAPTTARCELTELLVDQCAHCRGIPDPQPLRLRPAFVALYAGGCYSCGLPYPAGERIRSAIVDGETVYVAECCWEDR